jgi:monovalent cation:H+ antiporter-2, CPA2 family
MEASLESATFKVALIVLAAAGIVVPLFHRLRISPVVGFMLVGMAVGPYGLGRLLANLPWVSAVTIDSPDAIAPVARLGVVLLLFMIGLELSFERLWLMRRLVFGLGTAQVLAGAALLYAAARLGGIALTPAAVLALAGAMSSTAVVVQVLATRRRLGTPVGRASFAVLLFQDLAVMPVLLALGLLAEGAASLNATGFALAAGQALLAVAAVLGFGRVALRPLFRSVARTESPELFMAACLLVVLGTGVATAAAGLSMALGALLGGLLLAGTEFRRQVQVTIDPFKGLAVGVFLISVGMGLDLAHVVADPGAVFGAAAVLLVLKAATTAPLARAFGLSWGASVQAALLLAPGGEFGFVILAVAGAQGLLPPEQSEPVVTAIALTMALIPVLERLAPRLASARVPDPALAEPVPHAEDGRVIIAGFGRVGQTVAAMLEAHRVPYVAVDRDPDRVARERRAGKPVYFGDMRQAALLRTLDLHAARALVVTTDDRATADELVAGARAVRPDLLIVARARDAAHAAHLYRVGATDAVPETVEASLQLAEAVLVDVGVPMGPVIASIHEKRAEIQGQIKRMAPDADVRPLPRRRLRDARAMRS